MNAQGEIVVHRCVVRVVRHGGWSWGPDPRGLVDQVVRLLPELIAEQLDGIDPEASELGAGAPVRIVVPLRAGELRSRDRAPAGAGRPSPTAGKPTPAAPALAPPRPADPIEPADPDLAAAGPATRAALLQFLVDAANRRELEELLALLPLSTLEAWYGLLLPSPPAPGPEDPTTGRRWETHPDGAVPDRSASATPAARGPAGAGIPPPSPPASWRDLPDAELADELTLALAAAQRSASDRDQRRRAELTTLAAFATDVGATAALRALTRLATGGAAAGAGSRPGAERRELAAPAPASPPGPRPAAEPAGSAELPAQPPSEVEIASALPFLLLGPLATIGWLQTIAPALQAADLAQESATFATALAYTVLGPLERGWRRRPADLTAAAAFAGLAEPIPEPVLVELARRVPAALPALDALLAGSLAKGHTAGQPLLLAAAGESLGGGLVLADREGLFPIAWADEVERLLPAWRGCGSPLVLVGPAAAKLQVVRRLEAAGIRFVIGVPPTRDERWRRLPPPHRLWTNDHERPAAVLARQALGFPSASDRLADALEALAGARNPVPLATDPALRRSLTLAAGAALATIAWTLWRDREPTDPLLSFDRFCDLGARVQIDVTRVRVRLPLGRRYDDLLEHGLLADVHGTPWLSSRVVEFSGG
jgi:hypothetical protein